MIKHNFDQLNFGQPTPCRLSYTKGYSINDFNLIFYEYYYDRRNIFLLKYCAINSTIFFKPIVYALKFSLRFFQFYKNALGHRNVIHFQLKLSFVSKLSSEFSFKNFLKRKVFFLSLFPTENFNNCWLQLWSSENWANFSLQKVLHDLISAK